MQNKIRTAVLLLATLASLSACNPTVTVQAPDKPITINMNIKIEHEIRVKVEKDLENVLSDNSGLY
ncbi:MAG: YnbE family lipoprotein [Zetaproteobacteria bacterium CG_4_9_14_3_um_filter_49_83]|nr:MAG: YnbE family lipoprotein [Zetaproteobacteria bacterium CG1_02_49_23]PIQ31568.1 MAG: YnbE family lipoprotein [Zetaproteobacteria bacterium CG17_big_fil_post_rev_8_21_14_2_50_50_13]PIV29688.1 MAG: YnbE family lipoprotein [Zetaproteobacteria bacterium CG02_land_8_20_14_3_00_50_9]PIY54675.1 MAG: YnbE family lipoprotein [Zetaproteobacteria bacterium CG_4_10_14_0_8_um_filter_49_80]PJA35667.1 MAG: YnbE family lipoprotein [Zetaproteobacteria bacterium CG_4_9_14_3_um_filter_49_83]